MARLGVDVGGTFTDLVLVDDSGKLHFHKLPTTPSDPSIATIEGALSICRAAGVSPAKMTQFIHGTTVATNSLLEYRGAETGMITTEGFRDILHTARHRRPLTFSAYQVIPWQERPLIKRRHRLEVAERVIPPVGDIEIPLDEDATRLAARQLREADVKGIALCFLFSFLNPVHERRARELILEEYPESHVYLRSEVAPRYREYEAFSTVALCAFVGPIVANYIERLASGLRESGFGCELHLMTSAGGVATSQGALDNPALLLLSGPVGGALGGLWVAESADFDAVITLDVGGTSADIAVAPTGEVRTRHLMETQIGGYHMNLPMADIDTIGAGGGSIAFVDEPGMFHVGPVSAGAEPGPACYGRGGIHPTATDAAVVLGRMASDTRLAGALEIQADLARDAVEREVAQPLGLTVERAAAGIIGVLVNNMIQAIELNSVQKGYDPRDFVLVAAGGGGPLFACDIARELEMQYAIIPPHPGIASAVGLLASDVVYDCGNTVMMPFDGLDLSRLEGVLGTLDARALERLRADNIPASDTRLQHRLDCRYIGQGYELTIEGPDGPVTDEWIIEAKERFHVAHERIYSRRLEDAEIMIVTITTHAVGVLPPLSSPETPGGKGDASQAVVGQRDVGFGNAVAVEWLPAMVYERAKLLAGDEITGPAIIQQFDTTTVVDPEVVARADSRGNVILAMPRSVGGDPAREADTQPGVASASTSGTSAVERRT